MLLVLFFPALTHLLVHSGILFVVFVALFSLSSVLENICPFTCLQLFFVAKAVSADLVKDHPLFP
jgi:hypothetical protein